MWEELATMYLKADEPAILKSIKAEGKIIEDTEKALQKALTTFNDIHSELHL